MTPEMIIAGACDVLGLTREELEHVLTCSDCVPVDSDGNQDLCREARTRYRGSAAARDNPLSRFLQQTWGPDSIRQLTADPVSTLRRAQDQDQASG